MKITLNNYEAYALDYLEGGLTFQEEKAFIRFLDDHPQIKEELIGLNELVLVPDSSMIYPDRTHLYRKEKGRIIPFWGVSRLVAASVALLLISTVAFMVWKSETQTVHLITDHNSLHSNDLKLNQPNLPATRIPVPENEQSHALSKQGGSTRMPETEVMAREGTVSAPLDESRSSPVLNSGNGVVEASQLPALTTNHIESKPSFIHSPASTFHGTGINLADPKLSSELLSRTHDHIALSLLPERPNIVVRSDGAIHSLTYIGSGIKTPSVSDDIESYKIHIPGEFLSDTWTDVSVTNFKKKLIPQFIKNQLNL